MSATKSKKVSDVVRIVVMIVLTVILVPILAVNLTLIIKGSVNKDVPPDLFGVAPLAVTTGSMDGDREDSFAAGALIFVRILSEEEKNDLQEGDIVTFRSGGAYVTHRIVEVDRGENGVLLTAVTRGDANNATDGAIPASNIIGRCVGSVAGLGGFSMFLQTPAGILVFVGVPVFAFIAYDIVRITLQNRRARAAEAAAGTAAALQDKEEELRGKDEEIRRLRALVEAQNNAEPAREEGEAGLSAESAPPEEDGADKS